MKTYNRFLSLLIICACLLVASLGTAQKFPSKAFKGFPSPINYSALQRAINAQRFSRLTPPPLIVKTIKRGGVPLTILPKQELAKQISFLDMNQVPMHEMHNYILELQPHFDNRENFFEILAPTYYANHFKIFTPHLDELFQKIASLHDPVLELRVLKRMEQLVKYKPQIAAKFPELNTEYAIRIRYANDIETLTAENFLEEELMLSVEQQLKPSMKRTFHQHIHGNSTFSAPQNNTKFPIYNYNGPTEYLPYLYQYLVVGNDQSMPMFLVHDTLHKSLLLFNLEQTAWLRITPHEYGRPGHLHLHVHKKIKLDIQRNGRIRFETILLNLSIPVSKPSHKGTLDTENLYSLFIKKPVRELRTNPQIVTVIR